MVFHEVEMRLRCSIKSTDSLWGNLLFPLSGLHVKFSIASAIHENTS